MLYSNLGTLCSNLGMPYSNPGMLSSFVGTLCEGEDGVREESRKPHVLLPVPDPFRKQRRGHKECSSQGPATLRAHLGTSLRKFETPRGPATCRIFASVSSKVAVTRSMTKAYSESYFGARERGECH
jgi:hypothetical protein